MRKIRGQEVTKLAAAAGVTEHTVRRHLRGQPIRSTSKAHIERGAKELGIDLPTPPADEKEASNDN